MSESIQDKCNRFPAKFKDGACPKCGEPPTVVVADDGQMGQCLCTTCSTKWLTVLAESFHINDRRFDDATEDEYGDDIWALLARCREVKGIFPEPSAIAATQVWRNVTVAPAGPGGFTL